MINQLEVINIVTEGLIIAINERGSVNIGPGIDLKLYTLVQRKVRYSMAASIEMALKVEIKG